MDYEIVKDSFGTEWVVFDKGNGEFHTVLKEHYDAQLSGTL